MNLFLDSFWRAAAYCLHPRVIMLSLLPLAIMVGLAFGLGYLFWDGAVHAVAMWLASSTLFSTFWAWLQNSGWGQMHNVLPPVIVLLAVMPLVVIAALLLVGVLMMPAIVSLVGRRRFPELERKRGGSLLLSLGWSLASVLLALLVLILSVPLWLIPPLILILPPLIWGWLTYRVMAFDALAEHASGDERRELLSRHRMWLLGMGVATGYLGAAPSVVWASGWLFAAAFFVLIPLAIWIYTLVFAFSSLWFAHYCLAALEQMRTHVPAAGRTPISLLPDDEPQPQP